MYANATRELTRCATRHSKSRALTAVLRSSGTSSNRDSDSSPSIVTAGVKATSGAVDMHDNSSSSVHALDEQQQQQQQQQEHQQQQLVTNGDMDSLASVSNSRRAFVSAPINSSNGSSGMSPFSDAPLDITVAFPIATAATATAVTDDDQHHFGSTSTAANSATGVHTGSSSMNSGSSSSALDELDAAVAQRLSSHQSTVITPSVTSSNSNVTAYVSSLSSAMLLAKAKERARRAETALCSENTCGTGFRVNSGSNGSHSSSCAATAGATSDTLSRQNSTASVATVGNNDANSGTSAVVAAAAAVMLKRASTPKQLLRQVSGLAPPTATVTKVAAVAGESLAAERLRKAEERAEANRITELAVVVRRIAALIVLQTEASRKREAEGRNKQQKRPNTTKQSSLNKPVPDTAGTSSATADTATSAAVVTGMQSSKDALKHGRHSSSSANSAASTNVKPARVKGSMRPGGLGPHYSLAGNTCVYS
jgi:hypothetical protein